jgi:hypothetical protein
MGHVERNAKKTTEIPSRENANAQVVNEHSTTPEDGAPAAKSSKRQRRDGASPCVREFARNLHIFCAARPLYTPEVERRFMRLEDSIRQGASNRQVLEQIEKILDPVRRPSKRQREGNILWRLLRRGH